MPCRFLNLSNQLVDALSLHDQLTRHLHATAKRNVSLSAEEAGLKLVRVQSTSAAE